MCIFIYNNFVIQPEKFLTNSPKKEHVYVGRNEATGECTRIKFIDYLADKYVSQFKF